MLYTTPRTWHPHIYDHPPKRSTPHSIDDILGTQGRLLHHHEATSSCAPSPVLHRHGHPTDDDALFPRRSAFAELSPSPLHAFHAVHRDPSPRINVTDVDSESELGECNQSVIIEACEAPFDSTTFLSACTQFFPNL
jgi:hypothetical protein